MVDHSAVIDNRERHRFELAENGHVAFADYRRAAGELVITYVESPVPLRGTGAAGRLMQGVLTQARAEGLKVTPICGYAAAYMKRHPLSRCLRRPIPDQEGDRGKGQGGRDHPGG